MMCVVFPCCTELDTKQVPALQSRNKNIGKHQYRRFAAQELRKQFLIFFPLRMHKIQQKQKTTKVYLDKIFLIVFFTQFTYHKVNFDIVVLPYFKFSHKF